MQIQLKQNEIVAALTGYLAQQGITVANKRVDISFTAGRKNTGLSADVSIEDGDIPGFTDTLADSDGPKLAVVPVSETQPVVAPGDAVTLAVDLSASDDDLTVTTVFPAAAESESNTSGEPVVAETPAAKVTNSLFS